MTRSAEFARVRSEGTSKGGRYLVLATLEDEAVESLKWAFVTSRRVGNAVTRNLVRRRLRGILSKHGDRLKSGRHVVMIARYRAKEASFEQLEEDWLKLTRRLGILEDDA